ncbi:MAG: hypothetical protein QXS36_00035 [Candidatus Bathyarchaeia archaeon]|nr:hypothetical protein [Candidatus Bathyarchaeota archaeon]
MNIERIVLKVLESGDGVVRLAPAWVPRAFLVPGRRLKLRPSDIYALGAERGGIDERWLASTTRADNPGAPEDEGLSYIVVQEGSKVSRVLLKDAIDVLGDRFIGRDVMRKHGGWMVLAKFFDNACPIPLHLHQMEEHARRVNRLPKPEAYYFPQQLNAFEGKFPYTFFGLEPGTSKEDVKECLKRWGSGDNGILYLSRAYKLKPGTGWLVPAGVLHAPGTLVTYEVQKASDVAAIYQSMLEDKPISWDLLVKDVPKEHHQDLDYIVDMIDWRENLDPEFKKHHYIEPIPSIDPEESREAGYEEKWVIYGSRDFSAKELTVYPGKSVKIYDKAAYGLVVIQGHGRVGKFRVEAPTMIKYGELTNDELFVTVEAARDGVKIVNESSAENLVILKHFGPDNPDAPKEVPANNIS